MLEREAYENSSFGRFMSLTEDERWRIVFDRIGDLD